MTEQQFLVGMTVDEAILANERIEAGKSELDPADKSEIERYAAETEVGLQLYKLGLRFGPSAMEKAIKTAKELSGDHIGVSR